MREEPRFLRACRLKDVDVTPVWFMRQSGRYMPEYNTIRSGRSILELCRDPVACAKLTLLPVHRLGVDAAIIFSDLLLPLQEIGLELNYGSGGPKVNHPIGSMEDVAKLRPIEDYSSLRYLTDAVSMSKAKLSGSIPLIGFCGAPFTMAAYAIEGHRSSDFMKVKSFMYKEPEAWDLIMRLLVKASAFFAEAEVKAGVDAIQVFDSWVGCLSPDDYEDMVKPYTKLLFTRLRSLGVPLIHFGTGSYGLIDLMKEAGGDVMGIDWRVRIDQAWDRLGNDIGVQGNLDPAYLLGGFQQAWKGAKRILDSVRGRHGHIFNLGHGILPYTSVEDVRRLREAIHAYTLAR